MRVAKFRNHHLNLTHEPGCKEEEARGLFEGPGNFTPPALQPTPIWTMGPPYLPDDSSAAAASWRNETNVRWALAWLANESAGLSPTAYQGVREALPLHPGVDGAALSVHDLALGFELALGPMGLRPLLRHGMGVEWFGVATQQSVTDSAALHRLLWRVQPDLLVSVPQHALSSAGHAVVEHWHPTSLASCL